MITNTLYKKLKLSQRISSRFVSFAPIFKHEAALYLLINEICNFAFTFVFGCQLDETKRLQFK